MLLPICGLLTAVAFAGPPTSAPTKRFGRFGFARLPRAPRFEVADSGVRAAIGGAVGLRFEGPPDPFKPAAVGEWGATYVRAERAGSPSKLRVNLLAPGIELYFPAALALHAGSAECPYLSWEGGSVGPRVATAPAPWVLISFRDAQPPVLISFLGGEGSLVATGAPGDWVLRGTGAAVGWVRLSLPFGLRALPAEGVASLGRQVATVARHAPFWSDEAPSVATFSATRVAGGLLAEWTFDRAGAVVPPAIARARQAGYPLELRGRTASAGVVDAEGKLAYCLDRTLSVFLPAVGVPQGRALTLGAQPVRLPAPMSPFEPANVFEVAVCNLLAARDAQCLSVADGALADFLVAAPQTTEPATGATVPFALGPASLDLASSQALLMQSLQNAESDRSSNAILDSILAAQDPLTWSTAAPVEASPFAASCLALAAWLHPDLAVQARGAMLYAELAARPGGPGPLKSVLASAFSAEPTDPLAAALASPVRVASGQCVLASAAPLGWSLSWTDGAVPEGEIRLLGTRIAGATPTAGLSRILAKDGPGGASLAYRTAGPGPYQALVRPTNPPVQLPRTPTIPKLTLDRR